MLILGIFAWKNHQRKRARSLKKVSIDSIKSIGSDFNWKECKPLQMYPFVGKKNFNPSMGVKNISDRREDLFLIENTYLDCINLRKDNLENYEEKLIHCNESKEASRAVCEFYDMTVNFMCQRYPHYFTLSKDESFVKNLITGEELPSTSQGQKPRHLMKLLALNTEEDILIMLKDDPSDEDQEYILRASLTGLPAGFDPSHNYDEPISHIHKPVPQYKDRLLSPMHRFFNKLKPTDLWQRGNWSIQTNNEFFKLENHHGRSGDIVKELTSDDIDFDNGCFLRCERQLLTRLPSSKAVVMIVRTYLTPIKQIKEEGFGLELARGIESLPDDLAFYKRRGMWGSAVKKYLLEK